jgi:hypothetical protein
MLKYRASSFLSRFTVLGTSAVEKPPSPPRKRRVPISHNTYSSSLQIFELFSQSLDQDTASYP